MRSANKLNEVKKGQIRQMTGVPRKNGARLFLVFNVDGFRADVVFSSGEKDGIFTGWLEKNSIILSDK
jgi:hypothetical protein